eukprot:scaffold124036_cov20-Tisochrysis_lutea.AAC.5
MGGAARSALPPSPACQRHPDTFIRHGESSNQQNKCMRSWHRERWGQHSSQKGGFCIMPARLVSRIKGCASIQPPMVGMAGPLISAGGREIDYLLAWRKDASLTSTSMGLNGLVRAELPSLLKQTKKLKMFLPENSLYQG